ncbi:MAG: ABC transporter permease [Pseudomonadota bacterium]
MSRHIHLFNLLLNREIRESYVNARLGLAWALLLPVAMLAIYALVFTKILAIRFPESVGVGFIAFLAVAFWPWNAMADGLLRGATALSDSRSLIGKVQLPMAVVILSKVTAAFVTALLGYVVVLLLLALTGTTLYPAGIPVALVLLLVLYLFTASLGVLLSVTQVFFTDLRYLLPPLLLLGFFLTPVLYRLEMVPVEWQPAFRLNPMAYVVTRLRDVLLTPAWQPRLTDLLLVAGVAVLGALTVWYYRRLRPAIEEYL